MSVRDTAARVKRWVSRKPDTETERRRAERKAWAGAKTLADAGELTAQWAAGEMLWHPGGYDKGPDPETAPIAPALVVLNRAGFVTTNSQPGNGPCEDWDGEWWSQRAGVTGLTDPATADRIETAALAAGLLVARPGKAGWRTRPETGLIDTARQDNPEEITDESRARLYKGLGVHRSRRSLGLSFGYGQYSTPELLNAEQIAVVAPEWGQSGRLWDTLTRALTIDADAPELTVDDPDLGHGEEARHDFPSIEIPVLDRDVVDVVASVPTATLGPEVLGWESIAADPIRPAVTEFVAVDRAVLDQALAGSVGASVEPAREVDRPLEDSTVRAEALDAPAPQPPVLDSVTETVLDLGYGLVREPQVPGVSALEPATGGEPELVDEHPSAEPVTVPVLEVVLPETPEPSLPDTVQDPPPIDPHSGPDWETQPWRAYLAGQHYTGSFQVPTGERIAGAFGDGFIDALEELARGGASPSFIARYIETHRGDWFLDAPPLDNEIDWVAEDKRAIELAPVTPGLEREIIEPALAATPCPFDCSVTDGLEPVESEAVASAPVPEVTQPAAVGDEDWGPPGSGYRIVNINGQLVDRPVYWSDGRPITFAEDGIPAGSVVVSGPGPSAGPEISDDPGTVSPQVVPVPEVTTTPGATNPVAAPPAAVTPPAVDVTLGVTEAAAREYLEKTVASTPPGMSLGPCIPFEEALAMLMADPNGIPTSPSHTLHHSINDGAYSVSEGAPVPVPEPAPIETTQPEPATERPAGETPAETWARELRSDDHKQIHGAWEGPRGEECTVEVGKNALGLSEKGMRDEFGDPLIDGVLHRNDVKEQPFRQIARYINRNAPPAVSRPTRIGLGR